MTTTGYGSLFDAFRDNRGPILYSDINRTPAVEDVQNILIYVTFSTLFIAFLIIFPGIRKERFATFTCVTISLFLGAVILLCNFGTSWHVAHVTISSPYRAFSKDKIHADLGVHVGLNSVNITLRTNPALYGHSKYDEINYNERFYWIGPTEMRQEHQRALAKGLPFPILTVAEYLSQDSEGFCWGRRYRQSGYYASLLLWASFAGWILMNILLCAVPRYGLFMMQLTGILMLLSVTLYAILLPKKGLVIPFEAVSLTMSSQLLTFSFGWSFWLVLIAGSTAVVIGAIITIIDTLYPNKFSTILEIDYDTPYRYFVGNDAHVFGHMSADRTGSGDAGLPKRSSTPPPDPRDFGKEAQTFGRASIRKQAAARFSSAGIADSNFGSRSADFGSRSADDEYYSQPSTSTRSESIRFKDNALVSEIRITNSDSLADEEISVNEISSTSEPISRDDNEPISSKINYGFEILPEKNGKDCKQSEECKKPRPKSSSTTSTTTSTNEYAVPSSRKGSGTTVVEILP